MMLDALTLPNAIITSNSCPKKMSEYPYLWRDLNEVEESGLGIREVVVEGYTETATQRDALEQACEAKGEKKLYFESDVGVSPIDRYYKVKTRTAELLELNASVHLYRITCLAGDPRQWYATTDLPVF